MFYALLTKEEDCGKNYGNKAFNMPSYTADIFFPKQTLKKKLKVCAE